MKLCIFSVLPSPYQRDLFRALAGRGDVTLRVFYAEEAAPDSPWPQGPPEPWEAVLPGVCAGRGNLRVKWNPHPPRPLPEERVVLNLDLPSLTTQRLMRTLPARSWIFWGERLRTQTVAWRKAASRMISAPLSRARGIVGVGERAAADYSGRFPGVPTASIPYHCDLSAFLALPTKNVPEDGVRFLFCGQMIRRKGIDLLARAFSRLVGDGHNVRLTLVGRDADWSGIAAGLEARVRGRIEVAGFQPPDALPRFFGKADVFVLPSRHEGWGVVVNQAIGAGLPVLCSEAVGAGELVRSRENGLLFKADDADALYDAMHEMVRLRAEIPRYGAASRALADDWTPQAGAEKWVRCLEAWT